MIIRGLSLLWLAHAARAGVDSGLPLCGFQHPALPWGAATVDSATCPLQQGAAASNQSVPSSGPSIPPSWLRGSTCYRKYRGEWCVFTDPDFNNGEGVAIITSAKRLAKIVTQTSFKAASKQKSPATRVRYRDVPIPGKGLGLVASEPIRDLSLIMDRTPAVMADGQAIDTLAVREFAQLIQDGIEMLPEHHRSQYLNLTTHDVPANYSMQVYQIFARNAFRTGVGDGGEDLHSVFAEVSRMNHDCMANCGYYFDDNTLSQKVFAARAIMPGEELTVGYIDPFQSQQDRQAQLKKNWGFGCACDRCTAEKHAIEESDQRVEHIKNVIAELDDYSETGKGTPDKAEVLIALQELEGQVIRMYEAYYRAAIEWNGVGEPVKAIRYARMCLARGLVLRGPERVFVSAMRSLIDDPEKHWSWRFRLLAREKARASAKG